MENTTPTKFTKSGEYQINNLHGVVETFNLVPPLWYDVKTGGHIYLWTNLTNLKYNESITNKKDLKKVYYFGLGKKGSLGYKEGTYWGSCKDIQFKKDRENLDMEWRFEILDFYKSYELADWNETLHLWKSDAAGSKDYYNGNNGFKKVEKLKKGETSQGDIVNSILESYNDASEYFMEKDPKDREGVYNGWRFVVELNEYVKKFIPFQIKGRKTSKKVIDSVAATCEFEQSSKSIPPIVAVPIYDQQIAGFGEGIMNPSGNHRKKGCMSKKAEEAGVISMNVIYMPENMAKLLDEIGMQQFALGCNPNDNKPRQESSEEEHIFHVQDLMTKKHYPKDHAEIENYLKITCQIQDSRTRKKIKDRAYDKKNRNQKGTVGIEWDAKGWNGQSKRVQYAQTNDTTFCCTMSATSHNIDKIIDTAILYEKDGKVLEEIIVLIHAKNSGVWRMWRTEDKGIKRAKMLTKRINLKNLDGKAIKIKYYELPDEHPNIGVDDTNFWKTAQGENWLDSYNIKLKD